MSLVHSLFLSPWSSPSVFFFSSCFGIKVKTSILDFLSSTSEYCGVQNGMEHVVKEGYMIKTGASEYKFVHDKVGFFCNCVILNEFLQT